MKTKYNILILAFLSLWLMVGLNACSDDNSTGADQEDCNTTLPSQFAPATINASYFNSQTEPDPQDPDYSTYFAVQQAAVSGSSFFAGGAGPFGLASALLVYAQFAGITPEFEDGSCVWTITPPPGQVDGLDLTVTVYATPTSNGVNWEIIYDGELNEEDTVSDFRILTGFTSSDGSNGEWNYFDPASPNNAALTYTWDIESEENFELDVTAIASEFGIAGIDYDRDGDENFMTINDGENVTNVYWNEGNDTGWIELPGQPRMCYENFVNAACP